MPEVLSQEQIDALLQGFSSGDVAVGDKKEPEAPKAKVYDFKSPKKFTKEQLKTIDSLHENMSRLFSSYLSGLMRVFCEISVLQIEEQRYYEYSNALVEDGLTALVELKPDNEDFDNTILIFNMPKSIGFFMIDRLLGGSGRGFRINRSYTDIELAILNYVFDKLTVQVQESWRSHIASSATLQSIETNPRLLQLNTPEDIVVIVALEIKISNLEGVISVCISASNLAELMTGFTTKYERSVKQLDENKEEQRRNLIFNSLIDSDVEIKAVFDQFTLDLQDIMELKVDDVIPLAKPVNSEIQLLIDDNKWFSAQLGQTKLKKAVKVSKLI